MAIYSGAFNSTVSTTTAPQIDFQATGANVPRVMELGTQNLAATASTQLVGRGGNSSVQSSATALFSEDQGIAVAALTKCAVTWTTAPTIPTIIFRRVYLPATLGAGMIFTFPRGLSLAASAGPSLTVWNVGAASANQNWWIVCDE